MALGGLLGLLDDVVGMMDDVAAMSKVAVKKTAGITGDDLAVNAAAVTGIDPKHELPMVWRVAKGSLKNKALLVPVALGLSLAAPWAITPLLMLGGAYLCYEGVEKIFHKGEKHHHHTAADMNEKVKGAVKTDFILSAEIVAVTLGFVAAAPLLTQAAVLATIGVGMTVGVYGLVGGLVKLDDVGLHLSQREGDGFFDKAARAFGRGILQGAPKFMKALTVAGTAAMLLVGGGIIMHGIPGAEHVLHAVKSAAFLPGWAQGLTAMAAEAAVGMAVGIASIPAVKAAAGLCKRFKEKHPGFFEKGAAQKQKAVKTVRACSQAGTAFVSTLKGCLKTAVNKAVHGKRGADTPSAAPSDPPPPKP